jgi:serine protease Do
LQFGGEPIEDERDLARVVSATPAGKRVEVSLWRNRRGMTLPVEVGETEPQELAHTGALPGEPFEVAGMALVELSPEKREERGLPEDISGVLVADVEPGGPAAERGFAPNDIITRLGDREIGSFTDISNAMQAARAAGLRSVAVLVRRNGLARFLTLPVDGGAG